MSDQVGDEQFLDVARTPEHARLMRKSLQQLAAGGAGEILQEMARDILSGRLGLRQAVHNSAYAEALGEHARRAGQMRERLSPEERKQYLDEAERVLDAQRAEIEQERQQQETARQAFQPSKHLRRSWGQ